MRFFNRSGWMSFLPAIILASSTYSTPSFAASPVTTRLPIVFEPNRGQAPAETRYVLRGGALEGEFQNDGVRLRLSSSKKSTHQLKMRLVGSSGADRDHRRWHAPGAHQLPGGERSGTVAARITQLFRGSVQPDLPWNRPFVLRQRWFARA